jgi:hypothetical protein
MNTIEYILPAHWAPILINADYTGCTPEDGAAFDEFSINEFGERGFDDIQLANDDEPEFIKYHDAHNYGVLACDCLRYTFIR